MSTSKQPSFWDSVPLQAKYYYEEAMIRLIELEEVSLEELNEDQQTEAICLAAVKKRGWELKHVMNQTPEICIEAILNQPDVIQIAKYIPEELWYRLIEEDAIYVREFPTPLARDDVYKKTLEINPEWIEIIDNPSEELQLIVVEQQPELIRLIETPTEQVQKVAVSRWGEVIQFIENPTDEIKQLAVLKTPLAIKHIDEPSEDLQRLAVTEDSRVLNHLTNPSTRIILEALKGRIDSVDWIEQHIPYIVHDRVSEELLMTWAMNNGLKQELPSVTRTFKIKNEFLFIAKGCEGWVHSLWEFIDHPLIEECYNEMLTLKERWHFDSNVDGFFFGDNDDKMFYHSTASLIEELPETLSLLPNHERSYRRCRLAIKNNKKTKCYSPYHYWELKEAGQIK